MKKYVLTMALLMTSISSLRAITPEQILKDGQDSSSQNGVVTRKGSIKALIDNVLELNTFLSKNGSSKEAKVDIEDLRESILGLKSLNVFDVFSVNDWLRNDDRPGQLMVGVLLLQQFPEMMTPEIKDRLSCLSKKVHPLLKNEIEKLI